MTQILARRVEASQIRTVSVIRGWHCWNDYKNDVIVQATQEADGWTVKRRVADPADETSSVYVEVATALKSLAQVRQAIAAIYNGEDPQAAAATAPARRKAPAALSPEEAGVKVGDFFYTSWGYDQTNVEFFEVVALGAKSVKVRQVAQALESDDGYGSEKVTPRAGQYVGEVLTKILRPAGRGKASISFESYRSGWHWDGTPKHQTAAGWGH